MAAGRGGCSRSNATASLPTSGSGGRRLRAFRYRGRAPLTLDDVDATLAAVSDPLDAAGGYRVRRRMPRAPATQLRRERHLPDARARLGPLWQAAAPDALSAPGACSPTRHWPPRCRIRSTRPPRHGPASPRTTRSATRPSTRRSSNCAGSPYRARCWSWPARDDRPPGWPTPPDVGLPASVAATHDLMPVHPLQPPQARRARRHRATADSGFAQKPGPSPLVGSVR